MSAQLQITGPLLAIDVTVSDGVMAYNPQVAALVDALRTFDRGLPLTRFRLTDLGAGVFLYRWDTVDGRTWRQNFRIVNDALWQTFNVSSQFLETEFSGHRLVRDQVKNAMTNIGLTSLDAVWS